MSTKIEIKGNWDRGLAYEEHTLGSTYLGIDENGRDRFENQRSEMGELIYHLKYRQKKENVEKIIDIIVNNINGIEKFDVIIPAPPSKNRPFQPVEELAKELGKRKAVQVLNILKKTDSQELKDISDPIERRQALEKSMSLVENYDFSGKKILLLDDLYRSGSTLYTATKILKDKTNPLAVGVLAMTKTRNG